MGIKPRHALLAALLAAAPVNAKPAEKKDAVDWRWIAVAQPVDIVNQGFPAFEIQHAIRQDVNHTHSLALAFWGAKHGRGDGTFGYKLTEVQKRKLDKEMLAIAGRYKLYLMRSFHFNFGGGFRSTSTKEEATFKTGETIKAEKSASVLGLDVGVGNRWVLANGLVIGGNWLQVFVPVVTLASKDAALPDGYTAISRRSDAGRSSIRLVAVDLGYAW